MKVSTMVAQRRGDTGWVIQNHRRFTRHARQYPHFAVSLDTLLKVGQVDAAAQMVVALGAFLKFYEYKEEGISWASAVLTHAHSVIIACCGE